MEAMIALLLKGGMRNKACRHKASDLNLFSVLCVEYVWAIALTVGCPTSANKEGWHWLFENSGLGFKMFGHAREEWET